MFWHSKEVAGGLGLPLKKNYFPKSDYPHGCTPAEPFTFIRQFKDMYKKDDFATDVKNDN
jgi:hypothetical protein